MARARFLLRPRWLLSHLLVVALVILMVNLGFWQLRRLDERRALNELIEGRMDEPVVAIDDLVAPGADDEAVEATRFRRVSATGTYDDDATVVVRNRSQDGVAGAWLVTPLTLADGERVGVVRGFVGFADDGSIPQPPAPEGEVTVNGLGLDPGRLGGTSARDVDGLLAEEGVLPAFVQAEASTPPDAGPGQDVDDAEAVTEPSAAAEEVGLVTVARPELGEGPHLGYAVQWFIFSTIAVGGYALILRRLIVARGADGDGDGNGDGDDDRDPVDRELEDLLREAR